jgi:aryl-alcohol dehydrogenase
MMRTTAAIVNAAGAPFLLEDVDLDEPRQHEVLVRLVATGLCPACWGTKEQALWRR